MADGILYTSNGSAVITVGSNLVNQRISNSVNVDNDKNIRFQTVNTAAYVGMRQQSDDNFVFYSTNTTYGQRPVWSIFANSDTSAFSLSAPTIFNANINLGQVALTANNSTGSAGQVLTTNGSSTYWSTVSGGGSVNTAAQFTWSNLHTFQANVSFTGNGIGIASNTGAVYLGGISDANWRIGRNTGATTKWRYTNNSIDIITANSNLEGMTIGLINGNSYFETGYLGTFIASNVTIGNTSSNATINSTSFTGTASNASLLNNKTEGNLNVNNATTAYGKTEGNLNVNNATTAYSKAESALNVNSALTANNSTNLGGVAAASYQTTAGLAANVATLTANNATNLGGVAAASYVQNTDSRTLSGNLVISGTSFTPSSNTILLGNSTQRWVLSANTGSFSGAVSGITTLAAGNTTITGFANVTSTIQGGSSLAIAGALSGVTTAAMGNTTITGFANVSTTLQVTGNAAINGTLTTANPIISNIRQGYSTTVTAAGTTTLTVTSNRVQLFTGSTTQVLSLPAPQTMTLGMEFIIINNSTGSIEVRAANAATVITVLPGTVASCISIDLTAGNGAAGWNAEVVGFSTVTGTGSVVLSASPTFTGNVVANNITLSGFANVTSGANAITLTNATSNWIGWGAAGLGAPTATTRSAGTKLVLYPAISATTTDYAIGIDGATMWFGLTDTTCAFKWYANTTNFMSASPTLLNHGGAVNAASLTVGSSVVANTTRLAIGTSVGLQANGGIGSAGQVLTSNGTTVYWSTVSSSTSNSVYMKGGGATIGTLASEGSNIFRVNANTLNYNTTIAAGENAQATGPLSVAGGITLTVASGARVSIV
jgi:hypothetical protein